MFKVQPQAMYVTIMVVPSIKIVCPILAYLKYVLSVMPPLDVMVIPVLLMMTAPPRHAKMDTVSLVTIKLAVVVNYTAIATAALVMETVSHRPVLMQHVPFVFLIIHNQVKINTVMPQHVAWIMIAPLTPVRMDIVSLVITIPQVYTVIRPNVLHQLTVNQQLV